MISSFYFVHSDNIIHPIFFVSIGGLSLERPTMIKYRIDNIRNLFGHKVDMGMTKNAPICRFETADEEEKDATA